MMTTRILPLLIFTTLSAFSITAQNRFSVEEGEIRFVSEAPLEVIRAQSDALRGLIDIEQQSFAFSLPISTFEGFNSPLQRVHFNENYMESKIYPEATFAGKIIEDIDLTTDAGYDVRVKGKLDIHGVTRERIMRGKISSSGGRIYISCDFDVVLEEHNIRIPRIVHQKIAEVIQVSVEASLKPAPQQ